MKIDIVIPCFNEEGCIRELVGQLQGALSKVGGVTYRIVCVDDGSSDRTGEILDVLAAADDRITAVHLWGNHGHQRALIAGLDHCDAEAVLMMDADGQHPVDVAVRMIEELINCPASDVIQAVRHGSQGGFMKNWTSSLFYKVLSLIMPDVKLMPGVSDFRVIRSPVAQLLKNYQDRYRNLRVLLASLSLSTKYVEYMVAERIAGTSRYGLLQMLSLATNGWFAFSSSPLRLSMLLMCFSGSVGAIYMVYVLAMFVMGNTVPGWTSIIAFTAFMFAAVFGILAIMSEYMARIYEDVKHHPVYRLRPGSKQ